MYINETVEIVFRKSNHLVLRPILESDIPLLIQWVNDPELSRFLNVYLPMMEADEKEWFENLHKRKPNDIVFMIVVDGKPIGNMGIHRIDYRHGTATTGAMIGNKKFLNKGYGTEAKMLVLEYAFNVLNLRKICSSVFGFNERSLNYSLKCGYKVEGRRFNQYLANGQYWDEINLAVFREDWEPLWKVFAIEHKDSLLT